MRMLTAAALWAALLGADQRAHAQTPRWKPKGVPGGKGGADLRGQGEAGGEPPVKGRWGVGEAETPRPGKAKPLAQGDPGVPTLGDMRKERFLGGRRKFYGRGCAILDVDADGNEDVWLSNGDNAAAQDLFGVEDCASHLYLGEGEGLGYRDVALTPRKKRESRKGRASPTAAPRSRSGSRPLTVLRDAFPSGIA